LSEVNAELPHKLGFLFKPARYKVLHGGRGGAKSWGVARALLVMGAAKPLRILCAREIQNSISESVHKLLSDQIDALGLGAFYKVQESSIRGVNGTEFAFVGIRQQGVNKIKSFEGYDICWVEEAQTVTDRSWSILTPTIRKPGSEIWITFNPDLEDDPTYQRFVVSPPTGAVVVQVNYTDNPWLPDELKQEMEDLRERNPVAFENVWEGKCRTLAEGAILHKELEKAQDEGRIGAYPLDSRSPVFVAFDIGVGDPTCCWYGQKVGGRWRFVDYDQETDEGLPYFAKLWKSKPYLIAGYFSPHDGKQREWGTGHTPKELAANLGIAFEDVPALSVEDRIHATRLFLSQCEWDAEKCKEGLRGLRNWRWDQNIRLNERKNVPLHNWASHPGDGFSYFALSADSMRTTNNITFDTSSFVSEF
jgi:phage terminase large subunit